MSKGLLIGFPVAAIAVAAGWYFGCRAAERDADRGFRLELAGRFAAAEIRLGDGFAAFADSLPGKTAAALSPARAQVAGLALELSGWKNSLRLAYALTSGSEATAAFLAAGFERPLLSPARRAGLEVERLVRDYQFELARRDRQLRADFALAAEARPAAVPDEAVFRQWLDRLEPPRQTAVELAVGNSLLLAGTALDAIFVRQSAALLARLFSRVTAQLTAAGAAAGVGAVADGPLPVGDAVGGVILLGGTVWSGIDFYRFRVALPVRLEAELNRALNEYEAALKREALARARAETEAYRQNYRRLRQQLEAR